MARSRSRHRRYAHREAPATAAMPPRPLNPKPAQRDGEWSRPWVPWAVGAVLLLAGALVGWMSPLLVFKPSSGRPAAVARTPQPGPPSAEVQGAQPELDGAPGEQVELIWLVKNTGESAWPDYAYRFAPLHGQDVPVVSLPSEVKPGTTVRIRSLVTVPAINGSWHPVWELTGPKGPVPGGRLSATVRVTAVAGGDGPETPAPPVAPYPDPNPGEPAILPPQPYIPPVLQPIPLPELPPEMDPIPQPDPAPPAAPPQP